ncbi:hypothetical protein ACHQM5_028081 [Ranunculus cassubicifolius]
MNDQRTSSLKTRFALRFIRSLARIKMGVANNPHLSSMPTLKRRSQMIKLAADVSMASAVGKKRLWSRAVLFKIRNRARIHFISKKKMIPKKKMEKEEELVGEGELRRVVPGGGSMDLFKLLEETAHYMMCLNTQVEVMQNIVDLYSPPTPT